MLRTRPPTDRAHDSGNPPARGRTHTSRHADTSGREDLRTPPLDRRALRSVVGWYVVLGTILAIVGLLIVHVFERSALVDLDVRVARWFAARRTDGRNELGQLGSGLSDAFTLTPAVVVLCGVFLAAWRRWREPVMLGGTLVLEKALFLPVTLLVGRERPPVPQLDGSPPTSSYPSGHVAAAVVAYVALAVIVHWHVRNRLVRAGFVVLAVAAPLAVAVSRLHLGMHHLSDVTVGALAGGACLLVMHRALAATARRRGVPLRSWS